MHLISYAFGVSVEQSAQPERFLLADRKQMFAGAADSE